MNIKLSIMTRIYWDIYTWPGRTFNFTLPQILSRIANSGIKYVDFCEYPIEFWPLDITEEDIDRLRRKMDSLSLKASGITVPTFSPGLEIIPEERDRQIIVKRLRRAIEVISMLHGETVMYGISPVPLYASREQAYKWTMEIFRKCLDLAEERKINISIEFVNDHFPTSESIINFLDLINSERVGLCLEVENIKARPSEETLMEHLNKCGDRINLVHISDPINQEMHRSINVDLRETITALHDFGYKGTIVIESLNPSVPSSKLDQEVTKAAKYLNDLLRDVYMD